jgi:hypothetical protein
MARLRPRGLGCAIALYTWASRGGDLGVHPRCSDRSSAFGSEGRFAAHVSMWPTAAHLCGTRLEGGHQGLSRRYGRVEGEPWRGAAGRCRSSGSMRKRWRVPGCRTPSSRLCRSADVPTCRRACRRCCRALRLDPREPQGSGESSVPTLEASSAQVSGRRPHKTRAASAAFRTERGGQSEQRGWAPKALRRHVRARRGVSLQRRYSQSE